MQVIKDITQLKTCASGLFNESVHWGHIAHTQDAVLLDTFLPYLGNTICSELNALATISTDSAEWQYWLQRAMSRLMLCEYSKTLVEITPLGMLQTTSDNKSPAYKYKERQFRMTMLRQGYNFMERGMQLLEKSLYSPWINSPERHTNIRWVTWSSDLSHITGKSISRWDYERIVPAMDDISLTVISKIIPDSWRDNTIKNYLYIGSIMPADLAVYKLAQRAVANLGLTEAIARRWVQVSDGAVISTELTGDASIESQITAGSDGVSLKMRSHNMWGSEYVNALIRYIIDNNMTILVDHYRTYFPQQESPTDEECASMMCSCDTSTTSKGIELL